MAVGEARIINTKYMNEEEIRDEARKAANRSQFMSNHIYDHKSYEDGFFEGMKQALRIHDVMVRSEQLPCSHCGRPLKEHSKDSKLCPDRMKDFEQGN